MNELFNALYDKNACNLYKISLEVNVFPNESAQV